MPGEPRSVAVGGYYDAWTAHYINHFGDTFQAHRPTQAAALHEYLFERIGIRGGMRVLDAGCGVCGPAVQFARRCSAKIEALTISAVQARLARERLAQEMLSERVTVREGDFHELESLYPREAFDIVYFLESLSHSPDPRAVLEGVYSVLKPGGVVYVKDFFIRKCQSADELTRVLRVIDKVDRLFAVKTADAEEMKATFREVGFLPLWIEAPRFTVDNSCWQSFEAAHAFDLFDGSPSFDWSDWWEMRFQKP